MSTPPHLSCHNPHFIWSSLIYIKPRPSGLQKQRPPISLYPKLWTQLFNSFKREHRPRYMMASSIQQDGSPPQDRRLFFNSVSHTAFYLPLQTRRPSSFLPPIWQIIGHSSMALWSATCMQCEPFTLIWDIQISSKTFSSCSRAYEPSAFNIRGHLQAGLYVWAPSLSKAISQPCHPTLWVLWTALTMSHFGIICTAEYTIHNDAFHPPTWHLCVQDIQPQLSITGALHYISVHHKIRETNHFWQGMEVIIGFFYTQVCGACVDWDLLQHHCSSSSAPTTPFFQKTNAPLTRDTMGHQPSSAISNPFSWSRASTQAFMLDTAWELEEQHSCGNQICGAVKK